MTRRELINTAINEYLNTPELERSLTKIGEKYGVKRQTISKYLKEMGYDVINYQNRSRLNEHAFDSMDTEEQFYWLGFLYADGNISKKGNRLEMRLAIKDIDHLEKFRSFLKLTTPLRTGVHHGNPFCHLAVRNKHLWQTLYDLGCVPQKSLILKFPEMSFFKGKRMFLLHFIRGYWDGDGCLSIYMNAKHTYYNTTINVVGTEEFLSKIKEIFGTHGSICNKSCTDWPNKAYSLRYSGCVARKIARYLYEHATVYLTRKYEKYQQFCHLEEQSFRRKSSKIGEDWDVDTEVKFEIT